MSASFGWTSYAPLDGPTGRGEPGPGPSLDPAVADELARALSVVLDMAARSAGRSGSSATTALIAEHLGTDLAETMVIDAAWPSWQHVSVQRGVDAYLAERGTSSRWFGLALPHREHNDLRSLLDMDAAAGSPKLARPSYTEAAAGPDEMVEVLSTGLVPTTSPEGAPVILVLREVAHRGPQQAGVEVLCGDRASGSAVLARVRELVDAHDVMRGQVVSFGPGEHYGNELVTFMPRPDLDESDVILPDGLLAGVERHILAVGEQGDRLRELGIHLKRGLLLHGPPGTGKTHTVRYLMGKARRATVIVLSGPAMQLIGTAAALARRLTPAIVVLEDVDLIAQDRSFDSPNALLFSLLDTMDGVAADADITFVLTTNRAADLEEALVERPGRIDLAVEIPRPDSRGRCRLVRLYAGRARLDADPAIAADALDGVTASAIKELMRRAVLAAMEVSADEAVITDEILRAAVAEFLAEGAELTRSLLGAGE